tara:strand:- start:6754 stop:7053 length:300 start_codon:yes stop_codon:yes gene_type:complete
MNLIDIIEEARERGFGHNLVCDDGGLICADSGERFDVDDGWIADSRSTDMGTDPGDDSTVYLIETGSGQRGYVIVPASFYVEPQKASVIDALKSGPARR